MEILIGAVLASVLVLSVIILFAITVMLLIDLYHEVKRW